METKRYNENQIPQVAELLKGGQVVAIPTETVYGLAANALAPEAVAKIFEAKGRPSDNPLIVHIARFADIYNYVKNLPEAAVKLADAFWPGPLTMVLPKSHLVPDIVTAGGNTVAVRFPSHPLAQQVILQSGCPLAAPSANRSGSPSPTTAQHVLNDMKGKIAGILDGGECAVGVESTVVSLTGEIPRLLRPGGITPAQLEEVLGRLEIDPSVTENVFLAEVSSPGMKHRHYAPKAPILLLHGNSKQYVDYVNRHNASGVLALCLEEDVMGLKTPALSLGSGADLPDIMRHLFDRLRQIDKTAATQVYAHCPAKEGLGLAIYNRLIRAAAFCEQELSKP